MIYGPIARIILRYGTGAIVALGLATPENADLLAMDPDVVAILAALIGAATEATYVYARKHGWAT